MLNLTRLHLGIAHESQFQGLGITLRSLSQKRPPACYGDSGGTIHVPHEKENFDAPEVASIGRATRTSRSRERARTSHPHYGARSSFPPRQKKIFFREGTPELASPCRLFGRRDQSAFAPYGAMLKQSCPRFNANRRKGCSILNHCRSLRAWRLRPRPSSRRCNLSDRGDRHEADHTFACCPCVVGDNSNGPNQVVLWSQWAISGQHQYLRQHDDILRSSWAVSGQRQHVRQYHDLLRLKRTVSGQQQQFRRWPQSL